MHSILSNRFRFTINTAGLIAAVVAVGGLVSVGTANAQSVACACQASSGATGVLHNVAGNVFVSRVGGSVPAQSSMQLAAGDSVMVGPQSSSTVSFGDGCTLQLAANTTFQALPQGDQLCLAVNANAAGGPAVGPAVIAGGLALGAIVLAVSDDDKAVSK